ncbi:lipoprotein LipO [Paenibacillus baekrokdamisoli]|uniref:Lipoprotein LipO n=1 Tax=Paenibacillus baekrokdamisoli TaxID=1712516 RepID=A0A3G9IX43_9BACL|nr:extracellular solute-binding protein [Paenibacillus baekrokdamisoli]MBB3068655.1 putative aldouronate transport system substrate-binding protein [Paenibacillus baekrokdamisoli]BBH23487.1 lipoprotein LipO [Paenibacillus baekrokdamisoli]
MKKGNRRLISFMLATILVVLSACSNSGGDAKQSPSTSNTPTNSETPKVPEPEKPTKDGKYDPPITLTTVRTLESTVKFANGDSMENNVWTRAYEEEYGIKVKTLWAVDWSQWEQKMNLTIASGEIPDFFRVNATQFKQLAEAGMIADLTDVYNENASGSLKSLLNEEGTMALDSATIDGKLMAIPFTSPRREGSQMVYIRTDWLKALNLPEPKTMDDLLKISEAFSTQDPDKNGKQDTYGLAVDKDFALLNGFFNSFHAYPGIMIKDSDGNLTSGVIQPEVKSALAKLQEMFKAKQIDPEFGAKDITKVFEMIANGKIGMMYYAYYAGLYPLQAAKDKNPSMEWKAFPIMSVDSNPAKSQVTLGVDSYWVVKKEVEHPEAVLKMLDFWVKTFYENTSDEIYQKFNTTPEDGNQVWLLNNIAAYKAFKNVDESLRIIKALDSKDTSKLNPEDKGVYEKILKFQSGDLTNWGWNLIFNKGQSLSISDYYRTNNLYINDEFTTSPLESMVEKSPVLAKMQAETFTKIILGQSPVNEFDNFTKQWLGLGGKEILADVNQWYKTKK